MDNRAAGCRLVIVIVIFFQYNESWTTLTSIFLYNVDEWCRLLSVTLILQVLHCLKKSPPLNFLYLCQILTYFQNFCIAVKRKKFATKPIRHYPPHLRGVATVLWDI